MTPLFLYGTLRHRPLIEALTGGLAGHGPRTGRLAGWRVRRTAEGHLPALVVEPGAMATGDVWFDLPRGAQERLDAYEIPFGYTPTRLTVEVDGQPVECRVYLPPAGQALSDDDFMLDDWIAADAGVSVLAAAEMAGHDPALPGRDLVRQWPMLRRRAEAATRSAATPAPVSRRHAARPADATWRRAAPIAGGFFKLDAIDVDHVRFDGGLSRGLRREVLVGVDAALVLPYDPARDRVLLVEQVRIGPLRRGDPQPWLLEPVAGIVDEGETPEQSARREAIEEAHLRAVEMIPMMQGYATPGNATDFFHAWLGLCDLPDGHPTAGGLPEEHEDLRLHVLPRAEAMALLDSGEVNAFPLAAMLLWLDRWVAGRGREA